MISSKWLRPLLSIVLLSILFVSLFAFSPLVPPVLATDELACDQGIVNGSDVALSYGGNSGPANKFTPPSSPWTLNQVKIRGLYQAGSSSGRTFQIVIFDQNFAVLGQQTFSDSIFTYYSDWRTISMSPVTVSGTFYVIVLTQYDSSTNSGLFVQYTSYQYVSGCSYIGTVVQGSNYVSSGAPTNTNWMIRADGQSSIQSIYTISFTSRGLPNDALVTFTINGAAHGPGTGSWVYQQQFVSGTVVSFSVSFTSSSHPTLDHWENGAGQSISSPQTVTASDTWTAVYSQATQTLTTIVASGLGSVSPDCPSGCQETVGSQISVYATPLDSNWAFSGWSISGGVSCSNGPSISPCSFNMPNSGVVVLATFLGGSASGQITAVSVDKSLLFSTDTVTISVTVKNTGNAPSGFYLSATLFGPTRGYSSFSNIIQLTQGATGTFQLIWSPNNLQPSVDAGTYSVAVFLWNQRPNVTPIPSTLTILSSFALPFAFMVDKGNSYIEVTGGDCSSIGNCRLIHVHFSRSDLGTAKTFADLFWLLDTVSLGLSLTSLAGGTAPSVGDIITVLQYVLQRYGNQQLSIASAYGFYDITVMEVAGQYGKYYETSLVGLKSVAYQDLVSQLESAGLTVAAIIGAVALSVLSGGTATPVALWIIFAVTAGQTIWYSMSFFDQIPIAFFLSGNVPAYGVVTFSPPAVPVLSSPGNGATVTLPVTLSWQSVSGATSYCVAIWDGSSWILVTTTTGTSYQVPSGVLVAGHGYSWYVWAINAAGWSSPSGRAFTVV